MFKTGKINQSIVGFSLNAIPLKQKSGFHVNVIYKAHDKLRTQKVKFFEVKQTFRRTDVHIKGPVVNACNAIVYVFYLLGECMMLCAKTLL